MRKITQNLKKLELDNQRLKRYLTAHKRTKANLSDIVKRIEIEEAKDYLRRYEAASKQWCEDREDCLEKLLLWIEKRIKVVTRNIGNNG